MYNQSELPHYPDQNRGFGNHHHSSVTVHAQRISHTKSFLVLLDLSAAFDTIDQDNLFYILEKYVGIGGSALRLIRSYFSDRTQRVQIDGIMSDFASLLCGVPPGSVLGPIKFCLYLLVFMIILVVFAGLLIFTCVALEEFGTAQCIHALITTRLDLSA